MKCLHAVRTRDLRPRAKPGLRAWRASKLTRYFPANRGGRLEAAGSQKRDKALRLAQYGPDKSPLSDSSRHSMSWIFYRKSAPKPEPRSALEPPGLTPFWRLFRFSASVDHQMTPAWFVPLFRAYALSRHSLADWLSGTPSAALRPKASRRAELRDELLSVEQSPPA